MSDIVERLLSFRPVYGWPEEYSVTDKPNLGAEAAAEITRLRAELSAVRAKLTEYQDRLCVNCGKTFPASHNRHHPGTDCPPFISMP